MGCGTYSYNPRMQVSGLWDALGDDPNKFLFLENPIGWGGTDNNGTIRNLTLYAGGPRPSSVLISFSADAYLRWSEPAEDVTDSGG